MYKLLEKDEVSDLLTYSFMYALKRNSYDVTADVGQLLIRHKYYLHPNARSKMIASLRQILTDSPHNPKCWNEVLKELQNEDNI